MDRWINAEELMFRVEYRHFGGDEGPAIQVFALRDGRNQELLRFDCFRLNPHYHLDPSGTDEVTPMVGKAKDDPVNWTLEQLRTNLPGMLLQARGSEASRIAAQINLTEPLRDLSDAVKDSFSDSL